jgi:hypothetical protein
MEGGGVDKLTNRIFVALLQILNEAKAADPLGLYVPISPRRSSNGATILVLRDGFAVLQDIFLDKVQRLYEELTEGRIRRSY